MKLLLTSAGITNHKIADTLVRLAGKDILEIKVCVVSTASYPELGDKNWYVDQFTDLAKFGFKWVDVVDVSNPNVDWRVRLAAADVVYISGGNTFYLLDQTRKTGFGDWIKDNLDKKVFLGASAGSIIFGPSIAPATIEPSDPNLPNLTDLTGLNIVPFEISPHTPNAVSYEDAEEYAKNTKNPIYLLSNHSAVLVEDEKVEIVSKGEWRKLN